MDNDRYTLGFQICTTGYLQAAYMFMKRLVKVFRETTFRTTDKDPASWRVQKIEKEWRLWSFEALYYQTSQ